MKKSLTLTVFAIILSLAIGAIGGIYVGSTMDEFEALTAGYKDNPYRMEMTGSDTARIDIYSSDPIAIVYVDREGPPQVFKLIDGEMVLVWDNPAKNKKPNLES